MKIDILISTALILAFSVSLSMADTNQRTRDYHNAMKKLEKKTVRALSSCHEEAGCVDNEYSRFVQKRNKLVKSKLKITLTHFERVTKKTLKKESTCVRSSPTEAQGCFEASDAKTEKMVAALS